MKLLPNKLCRKRYRLQFSFKNWFLKLAGIKKKKKEVDNVKIR